MKHRYVIKGPPSGGWLETIESNPSNVYVRERWGTGRFRVQLQRWENRRWVFVSSRTVIIEAEVAS